MKTAFSLQGVEPRHRVDLWKTALSETFVPVELVDYDARNFDVRLDTARMGDLEVSHLFGVEQGICRPRRVIRPSDADPFVAVVQLGGLMSYAQGDEKASGNSEGVTLLDMTQDYSTMMRGSLDTIDVTIPRRRVEALFGSIRNLAGISLGIGNPMTRLITEFFRNKMQIADQLCAETADRLGNIGAELLATAFLEIMGRKSDRAVSGASTMARAKAFVRSHLDKVDLSSEIVAASQNLSLRRMQELFAEQGLSISDYIWEQRLLLAKAMLERPGPTLMPIANIAYAVGFISLPHFSRRFRTRFGCSPKEARQLAAGGFDS